MLGRVVDSIGGETRDAVDRFQQMHDHRPGRIFGAPLTQLCPPLSLLERDWRELSPVRFSWSSLPSWPHASARRSASDPPGGTSRLPISSDPLSGSAFV